MPGNEESRQWRNQDTVLEGATHTFMHTRTHTIRVIKPTVYINFRKMSIIMF